MILEAVTGQRLADYVGQHDIATPPEEEPDHAVLAHAEQLAGMPWLDAMSSLKPALEGFVSQIAGQAEAAPPAHASIAGDYLLHEQALLDFVNAELDGTEDGPEIVRNLIAQWRQP